MPGGQRSGLRSAVGGVSRGLGPQRLCDLADEEGLVRAARLLADALGELRLRFVHLHLGQLRDLILRAHVLSSHGWAGEGSFLPAYPFQFALVSPPEAGQVDGPWVAGDEAPPLFAFQPGLYLDAIVGSDAASAGEFVFVAKVRVVVIWRRRALHHHHDADLAAA